MSRKHILDLEDVTMPNPPDSVTQSDELRKCAVSARAYIKLALKEYKGVKKDNDIATAITDMTYELEQKDSAEEYLELALGELAYLQTETSDTDYAEEIGYIREAIERRI